MNNSSYSFRSFHDFLKNQNISDKKDKGSINEEIESNLTEANSAINEAAKSEPINEDKVEESTDKKDAYKIFKDRTENFECTVSIEGASLSSSKARIILEVNDNWKILLEGQIKENGKCIVPIKKGLPINEGMTGKISLEVIVEDQIFECWDSDFIVENAKKVNVVVNESKKVRVSVDQKK